MGKKVSGMFCIKCGKKLSDAAVFCAGCGTKVPAKTISSNPSSAPSSTSVHPAPSSFRQQPSPGVFAKPNLDAVVSVSLQGISADLKTENGSYDPVELGRKTIYDFGELLHILTMIRPLPPQPPSADICPASLVVTAGEDLHAFSIQSGSIIYSNDNRVVSVDEAMVIVGGQAAAARAVAPQTTKDYDGTVYHSSALWGSDHKDIRGLRPVRKPQIPPTDRVNSDASAIRFDKTPHFCEKVVKSHISTGIYKAPLIFSIVTIVLAFGGFAVAEFLLAGICVILTIGLFLLAALIKSKARDDLYLGFDWSQNIVYAKPKLQRNPSYLGNANCITGFSVSKTRIESSRIQNIGTGTNPMITRVKDDYDVWDIMTAKTDGSSVSLVTLYTEDDAIRVCQKANWLLSSQT
jgi:hypothetical protein